MEHHHHPQRFTCPMHPEVSSDKPGNCPRCGMRLVPLDENSKSEKIQHSQHEASHEMHNQMHNMSMHSGHEGHDHQAMIEDFKKRFYVVLVLTIPVMLLSQMIQHWLNIDFNFQGAQYVLLILSSIVFFYGGFPFLKGWLNEMKTWKPGMMTLIGFAITIAYVYSIATVLGLKGMDFFWELSTLILIMLLGHWIEMKSVAGASRELELLVQLMPADAHLVHDDHVMDVKTETLKENDIVLVKPGEKIPADGIITEGESSLNESMLTGESKPVAKKKNDKVIAGSINGNGSLKVSVLHGSKDSYLAQVVKLVQEAQRSKSKTQLLADKAAQWLTVIAIVAGVTTFLIWHISGKDLAFSIERMVTVIVICCPHALGLAVPLIVAKSTALSAKNGLLIKNRTAFENSRKITTLVFDKTGTLTVGKFEVSKIVSLEKNISEDELLRLASALEQNSEHPIATGVIQKAKEKSVLVPTAQNFKALTGQGVEAVVEDKNIKVVSPGYLKEKNISLPQDFLEEGDETIVFILVEDKLAGYIALSDTIRPESAEAIRTLHHNNIKSVLLTGDNKKVAESVSKKIGIDNYIAEVLPHQKVEKIKELQSNGEFVAMTGDGVNDAPALAQADVGIAVGSGSDIAAETAGIVLVNSNPKDIVNLILFGKATYRKMIQNLAWATGYNVIALPLAAGILYKAGILLSPAAGAVLMSLSTVVVAINFDPMRLDSYSYRVSFNPNKSWALQFSQSYIHSPEALHPEENIWRYTASALYASPVTMDGKYFASALVWGMNDIGKDDREHSVLLEGTQQFPKQALYGRYEFVQKSAEELAIEDGFDGHKIFNIHKFTLGTNRRLFTAGKIEFLGGVQSSINFQPTSLQSLYGNTPMSAQVYIQIRPKLMMMHNM